MKGLSKRFVDHNGKSYDVKMSSPRKKNDDIGFLDLWRYSTWLERAVTLLGVLISWFCSFALLGAVLIYGELSVLFVERHNAGETASTAHLLSVFGGGEKLPAGNRSLHMDALVKDSVAFAWASVVIMVLQLATAAIAVTLANWAAHRMVNRLRCELLLCVVRQEIAFFDTNTSLNFATALTEDMDKLRAGVGEHVAMTSFLIGSVVCSCALALSLGWQLTLAGLSIVPVAVIVSATVSKYQTRCSAEEVKSYSIAGRAVEEVLSSIRTVRAYGGEKLEVERYTQLLRGAGKAARKKSLWAGAGAGLGWLLTYAITSVIFAYGAILIVRDMALPPHERDYHPGTLITILLCTFTSSQNITLCNPHIELFSAARGAAKNLFPLLQRTSKIDALKDQGKRPEKFKGHITFDNVYFNYPSRPDVKVLRGLTLRVEAGETIALVGGSGCGKSTLLQLLQRLYEPESGSITVDGHRLNELHLHNFRKSIGVVGQEPVLFSGTIKDNIAFGNEDATDEEIILAAKTAHAHQFITKLANGYDTWLGERGASLSGGQKQRIAIARAVLRRPAILLLDEPTSALDPAAERLVQAALDAASEGRTTLVVSHRLSTIVNASRIVYMEQGAVLEQGTHSELLERRGAYWKLVQEDMTHKSIDSASQDVSAEDDDVIVNTEETSPLKRATSFASVQGSMTRGSLRLGTVTSAHISTYAAPDHINLTETKETPDDEDVEEVSSIAILKLNAKEWPLLLGGGVASLIVGATMPTFAFLLSKLYGMFAGADEEVILSQSQLYASMFACVAGVCAVVTFLQAWLFGLAGARLTDRLRVRGFDNYLKQEQAWYDQPLNSVGALCARLATDCAAVQGATGTRVGTVLQGVSTLILGMALALVYSWRMTIVSSFTIPLVIGGIYLEGYMNQHAEAQERNALENASRIATEAVLNLRTVQSLGVENTILVRYRKALHEAGLHAAVTRIIRGPVYGLCLCAPTLGYAVSMAYGGYLIARADLPYQDAILVSEALIYGAWMLAEALSFAPNFAAAKRSGARIMKALKRNPHIVSEPTAKDDPNWHSSGAVTLSSLHFRYPTRTNVPVLKGLTLDITPGHTVALVGPSGCGKSTVMQLLQRSYDPDEGDIALDEKNIKRDLTLRALRSQLGLVSQEPALFERTIRENIAYGDNSRDVSMEEVVEAAKSASVHSFIATLPLGYETRLGQGGAALSGGQKQRIAIARALVRNPRVLLLDEATSALDANSEKAVQASLVEASKDRTTIMIAHRLATVQHAHSICVINNGVVAERGSHDELIRKRGLYWNLLQQQGPNVDT